MARGYRYLKHICDQDLLENSTALMRWVGLNKNTVFISSLKCVFYLWRILLEYRFKGRQIRSGLFLKKLPEVMVVVLLW